MTPVSDCYRLAGAVVRVEWEAASSREVLGRAMLHRRVPQAAPELDIRVRHDAGRETDVSTTGLIVNEGGGELSIIDPVHRMGHRLNAAGTKAEWTLAPDATPPVHERAAPFRLILQAWLRRRAIQMLHAGAVGLTGHGAVLLAAPSGGGKSNTTLACLDSPLHLLGEDYVAVDGAETPRVWSLYSAAKLAAADLPRFPELPAGSIATDDRDGKTLLHFGDLAGRWAEGLPIRAILVLRVVGGSATRIVPAVPGEAVKAMLTSLLMVLPSVRRPLFEFTARLAARVPVYRLELGTDRRQIAEVIRDFLESPAS